jgi:hypothetical protein
VLTKLTRSAALACGLALAMVAACATRAAAQAPAKPVAVVVIASYDRLMEDVDYLGGLMNMQGASQMAEGMIPGGLVGLDRTKPIGVMVDMSAMIPAIGAYVPMTDQAQFLAMLAPLGITSTDMGNGVQQINAMGQPVFAKNAGGYTILGMTPEAVGSMPADPSAALAPLAQKYDVGIQFNVQSLPEPMRQQAIAALGAATQSMPRQPNETEAAFTARQELVKSQLANTEQMIREMDQVTIGLAVAGSEQKVYLDIAALAVPGTNLAQQMATGGAPTNFAGFANPEAAATLSFADKVPGVRAAQIEGMIDQLRTQVSASIDAEAPEAQREVIRTALNGIIDALLETVKAGTIDGGAVVFAEPNSLGGVVGGLVLDPAKIEASLKQLAETHAGQPNMPAIAWNAAKHGDIAFHTVKVPVPDEEAKALFGDQLDLIVGLGGQSAYFAWGRNADANLKQVIDGSAAARGQEGTPMKLTVTVGKMIKMLASVADEGDKPMLELASSILDGAAGKDHVIASSQPVENGTLVRLEIEQGVIQAAATTAMMGGMSGAGAAPPANVGP